MGLNITKADRAIDDLIEKRAREREQSNAIEAAERLRETSYLRHRDGDHTQEWAEFYRAQIRTAESARERAVQRLGKLLDEAATRGR